MPPTAIDATVRAVPTLKKTGGIATLLAWLLATQAVLTAIELLALANRYAVLHRYELGGSVAPSTIHAADTAVDVTTNVIAAILVVTIVIWCMWQHRAHSNAGELSGGGLHFSPGWAVGWWFVPIADLWMPFRTVRELWKGSHGPAWQGIRTWGLIGWWWALWLVSWIQIWTGSGSFSVGIGSESRVPVTGAGDQPRSMAVDRTRGTYRGRAPGDRDRPIGHAAPGRIAGSRVRGGRASVDARRRSRAPAASPHRRCRMRWAAASGRY